jgi:hypothetical protein
VPVPYPVSISVEPHLTDRNRLTTAFRIILAIPHLILVGGVGLGLAVSGGGRDRTSLGGETGILGGVAWILAIVSWVTILIGGEHINAIRRFSRFYLRWRVRAIAYLMLLEDRYPPFGDAVYPTTLTVIDPQGARNRLTVGLRILLAIPHFIVLVFLLFAWWVTSFVAWVLILVTGSYPSGLYTFALAVMQWLIRVEAYMLLLVDDYPPFSFT